MADTPSFDGAAFARSLPHAPGVYRMLASDGSVLYIGKAIDLRRRVGSYFQDKELEPWRAAMVTRISRMDTTVTGTETEALILESRLIKTQRPRYNIALKDDRGYPYLFLSTDQPVPRIRLHRGRKGPTGDYFGPYPSWEAARAGLDAVLRGFQLRSCNDAFFSHRSRPCLQHQIGRCSAPCVPGHISPADYLASVQEAKDFLSGKSDQLLRDMTQRMEKASQEQRFEHAALLRDRLGLLRRLQTRVDVESSLSSRDAIALAMKDGAAVVAVVPFRDGHASQAEAVHPALPPLAADAQAILSAFLVQFYLDKLPPEEVLVSVDLPDADEINRALSHLAGRAVVIKSQVRGERAHQLAMAQRNADAALAQHQASRTLFHARRQDLARLLDLPVLPERLECFDISHTGGKLTRASCVVFGPEGPLKAQYRHYRITGITPGDDYAAMHQALTRRFARTGPLPDLLLIDGGAGQVAQAVDVLKTLNLSIPIVGLAKGPERKTGQEDLLLAWSGAVLHPGPHSAGLMLLAHVRDESHRFAIQSHRKAREKNQATSPLENIIGVGPVKRKALLLAFGGLQALRRAGVDDLTKVEGISRPLAERILAALRSL